MVPTHQGDGPGRHVEQAVTPAPPFGDMPFGDMALRDIVPVQAMANGGMIVRPGAVAWGGLRGAGPHASCEAVEQVLSAAARDPAELPALLNGLATARLWVPLPGRPRLPCPRRPFTDGAAVLLPLVTRRGTDFVPCFTSVQRLTAWAERADSLRAGDPRTGAPAVVPHIVVPAAGLARRLPAGFGLAVNPGSEPGLPLYPECVPALGELAAAGRADAQVMAAWVACNTTRLYSGG